MRVFSHPVMSIGAVIFIALVTAGQAFAASPEPIAGENGMVVTSQRLASQVGADVLRKGGNAIDAAVAVGYALAVVDPCCGNIGGGGFMTVRFADGHTAFLDFRERAPLAATETMYQDTSGNVIPGLSLQGYRAVAVPGTVMGLEIALERWGRLPRATLMAPAIALAKDGFVLSPSDVDMLDFGVGTMRKDPAAAAIFLNKDGTPFRTGDRLVQKDLAQSLQSIADTGADAFYKRSIAKAIVAASASHKGILQQADFDRYTVRDLKPIACTYRGYVITSSPPPSSGGTTICEILNILEGYPMSDWGFHSAASVHAMIEAMRYAFADRNDLLGDPAFVQNPLTRLNDKTYAASLRAKIDPEKAGQPPSSLTLAREAPQTTHYSIVDKAGNAVAVTYTIDEFFGAQVVAGGTGILMNNEMDDFTAKPGSPNMMGLVQGKANAIAPGKTPLSSMSPTIVSRDGKTVMIIGAAGGPRIITAVLEAIVNVIDYKMNIAEAIDAPRLHFQGLPNVVMVERFALSPDTERLLSAMGYRFQEGNTWANAAGILIGGPSLATRFSDSRFRYFGAADARKSRGAAVGE